jgi:hypothetical protein
MKNKLQEMIEARMRLMDDLKPAVDRYYCAQVELQHLGHVLSMMDHEPTNLPLSLPTTAQAAPTPPATPTGTLPTSEEKAGVRSRSDNKRPRGCGHLKHTIRAGSRTSIIADAIRALGGQATITDLAAHIGIPAKKINDALVQGTRRGTFTRVARARFAMSVAATAAPTPPATPTGTLSSSAEERAGVRSRPSKAKKATTIPHHKSAIHLDAERVLSTWRSGREFTREELIAEMDPDTIRAARPGAMADMMIRLRESGQIGMVSAPTPTRPATYKTA